MKFVLDYRLRDGGSETEREEAGRRALTLLGKWQPSDKATIREWVSRVDGDGGYAVIETDDAKELFRDMATWSPFLKFHVIPVLDILEATPLQQEAAELLESIS